ELPSIDEDHPAWTASYPIVSAAGREARWFLLDIIDAFQRREIGDVQSGNGNFRRLLDPQSSLSVVQLRRDLKRLMAASRPFAEAAAGCIDLLLWVDPMTSLLLTLVYMYSVCTGYLWPLLLTLLIIQLTFNYFKAVRNIDIGIMLLPRREVRLPSIEMSSGQLLIDVAKVSQWTVKIAADIMEKCESLVTWKRPSVTFPFFLLCIYWLLWSLCFSVETCLTACALAFGVRLFVTTYLFHKFPRLRYRLDTFGYFYRNLPVKSGELLERPQSLDSRTFPSFLSLARENDDDCEDSDSDDDIDPLDSISPTAPAASIAAMDSLPHEECDLIDDVIAHRECVMIEKGSMRVSVSGTLHLTPQALIFRAHKREHERVIILDQISVIRKVNGARPLAIILGWRRGLEVEMADRERISFIGIARRYEFFESLRQGISLST
ncbi:hypothetical protein PFISCL1PPCAC_13260, partial [Pristionchus fissidentatus]